MPRSDHAAVIPAPSTPGAPCPDNRGPVCIGLINNMPDAALRATERQFKNLIQLAADGVQTELLLFALPGISRSDWGTRYTNSNYLSVGELWGLKLDGLIVTGAEPRAGNLAEEPYWIGLSRVIDWAAQNTCSAIWSCLAAHAVVQHCDGIRRQRLAQKRFGVFECTRAVDDPMMEGLPSKFHVPHSRWHDLPAEDLTGAGYSILSRDNAGNVDAFAKQGNSLFLFFQGHPEYEHDTLLLEYRRDLARHFEGHAGCAGPLPEAFTDEKSVEWTSSAVRIYKNWIGYLVRQRELSPAELTVKAVL